MGQIMPGAPGALLRLAGSEYGYLPTRANFYSIVHEYAPGIICNKRRPLLPIHIFQNRVLHHTSEGANGFDATGINCGSLISALVSRYGHQWQHFLPNSLNVVRLGKHMSENPEHDRHGIRRGGPRDDYFHAGNFFSHIRVLVLSLRVEWQQ
ncbi:hypothetical protein Cob_v002309 [Colletotrichum orbiculare MAFF 240422]|uniref:Uncharacterized protein n=1 Tax=Colletotrichum orbiculare (strain 104-T / ATCC 96160 / CBS 514.97 / LARS 414 / MAFF 240422) TaxID=1213857 RepID=A0A484G3B0_COLOR|nr:hypothetical protein Cob_v002309 [Colletotrichum orbiculare MAFF 240422]